MDSLPPLYGELMSPLDASAAVGVPNLERAFFLLERQEHGAWCGVAALRLLVRCADEALTVPSQSHLWNALPNSSSRHGLTLATVSGLVSSLLPHRTVTVVHASQSPQEISMAFSSELLNAASEQPGLLLCNFVRRYDRLDGREPHHGGHFACVAGSGRPDRVVVFDPSPFFPVHTLALSDLVDMMCTIDRRSGLARGWIRI